MDLADVPAGCRALRCETCGDHLAIPADGTLDDVRDRSRQAIADHKVICPGPPEPEPTPMEPEHHGSLRQQLADLLADPTWCPGTHAHHCGHWKHGGTCCNCYEARSDAGPC
jgi:hypothetical protein